MDSLRPLVVLHHTCGSRGFDPVVECFHSAYENIDLPSVGVPSVFELEGMSFLVPGLPFETISLCSDAKMSEKRCLRVCWMQQCGLPWAASSTAPSPPAKCSSVESPFFRCLVTVRDVGPETIT